MSDLYRFGQFVVDSHKRTLSCADSQVSLTPKAFDVLLFLVQHPRRLVTKEELLQAVWGDTFVEEGNLTQHISHLRKALGDNSEDSRLIVTIARKGYQFTGDVVAESAGTAKPGAVLESSTQPASPRATKLWRKVAILGAAAVLVVAGYMSWQHFRANTTKERIKLAVLPFENLTGDPNQEYLADGLTEETISQLARLDPEKLGVIARTSVMGYKHKNERLDQIGRDLSVQYVLENSLRMNGNQIRLTAQLIEVKGQTHLWAQDYDYELKHVLDVEDDVAKAVVRQIQLRLTSQERAELTQPRPVNPEAFEAYLQGNYIMRKDDALAAKYFERAIQLDPGYARAWVRLAVARFRLTDRGEIPTEEGHRLVHEAIDHALALEPNLAEAHAEMGTIKGAVDFDWIGGDASYQRAVALEPGNHDIVASAAYSAAELGRMEEALKLARRAVELDPLNGRNRVVLGQLEYWNGDVNEAIADIKRGVEISPKVPGYIFLAEIYVVQGRSQDAFAQIEQEKAGGPFSLQHYAMAYHAFGQEKKSEAALQEMITKYQTVAAFQIAEVYAFRKQPDEAFAWLDKAYAQQDGGLGATKIDPLLKSLRGDSRYVPLLRKIHLQ